MHWLLEELKVPYKLHVLDMSTEDHKKPEYLAINPMGKVPALQHGDRIMSETAAICTYLAEAFPDSGLHIPVDSPFRADYLKWLFFAPVTAEPSILWQALDCKALAKGHVATHSSLNGATFCRPKKQPLWTLVHSGYCACRRDAALYTRLQK